VPEPEDEPDQVIDILPTPPVEERPEQSEKREGELSTPLKFEDLAKESKSTLGTMELFDGFRFEFNKTLGENPPFGVSHALGMGSVMEPPSYNFASNLMLGSTLLSGRLDTDGHMMGRWHQDITKKLAAKISGQASPEPHSSAVSLEFDYKGNDWFGNFKWNNQGIYGISYTQAMTPTIAVGAETFYHHQQGLSLFTLGARYDHKKFVATGMLSMGHCNVSYTHKVTPRIAFATELQAAWGSGVLDTIATGGFEYHLRASHLKCHIDTNGKVTALVEEVMNQFTNISLCAELDHSKKQYHFGIGVAMNF